MVIVSPESLWLNFIGSFAEVHNSVQVVQYVEKLGEPVGHNLWGHFVKFVVIVSIEK